MISASPSRVSARHRNGSSRDEDFELVEVVRRDFESPRADFEARTIFDDSQSPNPMGVVIEQETFAWADEPNRRFVLMQFVVSNPQTQDLQDVYAGFFMDWDINTILNKTAICYDRFES